MAFRETALASVPELTVARPATAEALPFLRRVKDAPRRLAISPRDQAMFPHDAVAQIYRPARSAKTAGKARTKHWLLRFERRTPAFIEPLMGWTGGDDTLQQVELRFPDLQSAVAYAERQGLSYRVTPATRAVPPVTALSRGARAAGEHRDAIQLGSPADFRRRRPSPPVPDARPMPLAA